ncbi:MAG: HAMP domain-containing sensor histidine kinase [Oscillospiraceae bacterium]
MTTKRKRLIKISIKHKIWLAIMATVIVIIGALWLLQVVFFEDYYLKKKGEQLTAQTAILANEIKKSDQLEAVGDLILKISNTNNYCVDVSNENGVPFVRCEGLGDSCVVHHDGVKSQLISLANKKNYNLIEYENPKYNINYMSCTKTINVNGQEYIILVTTTLSNITEATTIIRKQLIYISLVLIILATIIAFLVARTLTKRIRKISDAAIAIANGNLNVDVLVKGNDEIKDLSNTFDYMAKRLERVNISQKEMIANISHDLRTPLTMIKGYAEAIKDITGDNKEMREHQLDIIVSEVNHLSTLTSDVMDLSLMQAGQIVLKQTNFDIAKLCNEILLRFELLEQTTGFEFLLNSHKIEFVYGDIVRIEQVIYNLLNNAVNHIGDIKKITISLIEQGDFVRIEISDTGCGISREDLPNIWNRYYKPQKKEMGTGLGLSIVQAILQEHRSNFGVISTVNVGSTFWFTLKKSPTQ